MPFTPFHMGPGLAFKAVGGRRFSLLIFGLSQVAIDVEPLVRLIRGDAVVHGFTHTYLGATLIAAASVLVGRPACQLLLDISWNRGASDSHADSRPLRISWSAAISGAFIGTYSHVFLDSLMHSDMHPLFPFSETNTMLGVVSLQALHLGCVICGLLGALLLGVVSLFRRATPASGPVPPVTPSVDPNRPDR